MGTQQNNYAFEASVRSDAQYQRFQGLKVCSELTEEESMQLYTCLESQSIAAGTTIYEAESLSNQSIYLITRGHASVSTPGSNIHLQLAAGDVFGLFSFLDEQRSHAATVKAVTDLEVLTINRSYFDLITLEEPELGSRMLRFMFHLLSQKTLRFEHEYAAMHEFETAGRY